MSRKVLLTIITEALVIEDLLNGLGKADRIVCSQGNAVFEGYPNDVVHRKGNRMINLHRVYLILGLAISYYTISPCSCRVGVSLTSGVSVNPTKGTPNSPDVKEMTFLDEFIKSGEPIDGAIKVPNN